MRCTYKSRADVTTTLSRLDEVLTTMEFSVRRIGASIEAKKGSRTRTWWSGAMRADPADLPIRLEISMREAPEGSHVEMRITDRFWLVGLSTGAEECACAASGAASSTPEVVAGYTYSRKLPYVVPLCGIWGYGSGLAMQHPTSAPDPVLLRRPAEDEVNQELTTVLHGLKCRTSNPGPGLSHRGVVIYSPRDA